ncbi:MAG: tRNA pseudouridine(38-40) synthase TruA [Alphaproteobacteria bacterium]|nr:tRNA pseudouridine(38-40) synthase TruA [Alphaproteobacteria bacterium]
MRYKITVEYDGTDLVGWQRQKDGASAQEYLENAFEGFSHQKTEMYGAGRTDAGVHALAQVAHFDTDLDISEYKMQESLNALLRELKAPVCVYHTEKVSEDFHARFSATARGYIYRILNRRGNSPLNTHRVWHVSYPLDVKKMQEAARFLIGHHDFSSFRGAGCQAASPVKTLDVLNVEKQGDEIIFNVEAKSFIYHQVRNMVGTLQEVGTGKRTPEDVRKILEACDRRQAGVSAPACGLYLSFVRYEGK